jgi:hypothetical protein
MSQVTSDTGASLRRISVVPIARDARLISEIPPPITVASHPVARRVEFAALSRVVQDRFLSAVAGTFPPSPIVRSVSTAKANAPVIWIVLAIAASAAGVMLFRRGFGTIGDAMSIHSVGMALVFAALVAVVVLATLRAIAMLAEARVLPYASGIYLFPTTLIDARRATLEVVPLTDLVAIEPQIGGVHLVFAGGRQFTFELDRDASIESVVASIEAARTRSKELAQDPDPFGQYALVDPLHEPPQHATPSIEPRLALQMPGWARHAFVLAVVAGAVAGPVLRWRRNAASDARMFADVCAADSVAAYRAYLAHGGAHRDEVESVLLPRAEQRDVRAALIADLERATKVGTLAALDAFDAAHPDHGVSEELAAARHAVYVAALDRYHPLSPDEGALTFVTRLLSYSEAHGPTVHVRFVRADSPTLAFADHAVESSSKFAGVASYPSRYFDVANAAASEAMVLAALRDRFSSVFPSEILTFAAASESATATKVPVLTIVHHVEWNGDTLTRTAPPGVYIEPTFELESTFSIPDGGVDDVLGTTVPGLLPDTSMLDRTDAAAPPEHAIYRVVSLDAFDRFGATLVARFLR